jgi:hypothetical protein
VGSTYQSAGSTRRYFPNAVATIKFVKDSQQAGFSLREIQELLDLRVTAMNTCGNVWAVFDRKAHRSTMRLRPCNAGRRSSSPWHRPVAVRVTPSRAPCFLRCCHAT